MRAHIHLLVSAAAGIAIYPRSPKRAVLLTLAGVLIDVDHYLLYALRSGDWSLHGVVSYAQRRNYAPRQGDTRPRYGPLRSIVHQPLVTLPVLGGLSLSCPLFRPILLGVAIHLALDSYLLPLDLRVWWRAGRRCERCHVPADDCSVYYRRSPKRGGSRWSLENRVLLCKGCLHEIWLERQENT